jgi:hypothetical protein
VRRGGQNFSMLQQLIYVSKALTGTRTEEEIGAILSVSRARNEERGVSGVLLFRGTTFLQLLEGPPSAVHETYARICRDPRHRNVVKLVDQPVKDRLYQSWAMGYRGLDDSDAHLVNEILGWSNLILKPDAVDQAVVVDLLRRFREPSSAPGP